MGKKGKTIIDYQTYANSLTLKYDDIINNYSYGEYSFNNKKKDYKKVKIDLNIKKYDDKDKFENEINKIALWKIDRIIVFNKPNEAKEQLIKLLDEYKKKGHGKLNEEITEIAKSKSNDKLTNNEVYNVLDYFLNKKNTKGIRLAMLSTILRFYMPEVFPIIDVRAYRSSWALYYRDNAEKEYEDYKHKGEERLSEDELKEIRLTPIRINEENRIVEYCRFILRCRKLIGKNGVPENATMEDMDKYLYGLDNLGEWNIDSSLIK